MTLSADSVVSENMNEILEDFKPLGASFLTKFRGEYSEMPIHQDWTVVDENQFGSNP